MVEARSVLRAAFAACVLLSAGVVASGYATYSPAAPAHGPNTTGSGSTGENGTGTNGAGTGQTGPDAGDGSSPRAPASGVTVVTTDSNRLLLGLANDSRAEAEIVAYDRNGSVRYYNATHDRYWDVDPVVNEGDDEPNGTDRIDGMATNGSASADGITTADGSVTTDETVRADGSDRPVAPGSMTVEYVASDRLDASACELDSGGKGGEDGASSEDEDEGDEGDGSGDDGIEGEGDGGDGGDEDSEEGNAVCARNVIERVNLTTGAVTRIYAESAARDEFAPWNDVDRINDTHYVVADRTENRVFVVDVRTDEYVWEWYVASAFPFASGGYYLEDWTHLNDVEYTDDGRIMASLRNHDQVIFLDPSRSPERAVVAGWTLGADDDHTVLYEQYNPDYIPRENGGPAILVADAENNRVVEYARRNGSWNRTWEWEDDTLQWPRDADRLPNGHTLVVDSNGDRVIEVTPTGEVVWNITVGLPYDAERLSSGPESAGGPSVGRIAARTDGADDANGPGGTAGRGDPLARTLKGVLSGPALSAVLYLSPAWMGVTELVAFCVLVVLAGSWALFELHWRSVFADVQDWAEGIDRQR